MITLTLSKLDYIDDIFSEDNNKNCKINKLNNMNIITNIKIQRNYFKT